MARSRAFRGSSSSGNGGIFGSGIFGLFGSTVQCDSETNSLYCNIVKIFNIFMIVLVVGSVLYFAFSFLAGASRQRGGVYRSALLKLLG